MYHSTLQRQAKRQERELSPINNDVAQTILAAGLKALVESRDNQTTNTFKVVSAPTGSSKTNSAIAFAISMWKLDPTNFTCAFVVEEIASAQGIYESLIAELPDTVVGCWTSYHDIKMNRESDFDKYQFKPVLTTSDTVKRKQIAIYTHRRWLSEMERDADYGVRRCNGKLRDVLFIDEQPSVIQIIEQTPADILKARDQIMKVNPEHEWNATLLEVVDRMNAVFDSNGDEHEATQLLQFLEAYDFTEEKAQGIWRKYNGMTGNEAFMQSIKFLQACTMGYSFLTRSVPRSFVAYLPTFKPEVNQVILDATADLSGLYPLLGGDCYTDSAKIDYSNLQLHHITTPVKYRRVNAVIKVRSKAESYAEWIKQSVMNNTKTGDRVLVVMHKAMISTHGLFEHSPRVADTTTFEGRTVNIIWWGQGIGSNQYKDCTEVFMFSEFYRPRRITVAETLGAKGERADEANLDKLNNKLTSDYLSVEEGDLLRWTKQLACRGNVRNVTADGKCGHMRLHTSMDFNRLMHNLDRLFPCVKPPVRTLNKASSKDTGSPKRRQELIDILSTTDDKQISFKDIEHKTGIKSFNVGRELTSQAVKPVVSAYGWIEVSSKVLNIAGKGKWLIKKNTLLQ